MNRYDPILFDTDPQDETRQWQPGIITSEIEHIADGLLQFITFQNCEYFGRHILDPCGEWGECDLTGDQMHEDNYCGKFKSCE